MNPNESIRKSFGTAYYYEAAAARYTAVLLKSSNENAGTRGTRFGSGLL